jgi:methionyl-tRNA synthetase
LGREKYARAKSKNTNYICGLFPSGSLPNYNNLKKMIKPPKRYMITSALPYANGPLHIGHLAGAYIPADIYVRYLRLQGRDVLWVCGSDEHGAAITIRAMKDGLTPREIIDKYDAQFRTTFEGMGIAFDIFHRTSLPLHFETAQDFFRTLFKNDAFEVIENEQYFDEEKQVFLADRYIAGVCPVCGNPDAYGDQCERCGSALSPNDLLPPIRSTLSGSVPIKKTTKHWFLKLNEHEAWLNKWINEGIADNQLAGQPVGQLVESGYQSAKLHNPDDWKPHVLGQCKSWLAGGLQPRAMTRDLDWGIPVPPEIDASGQKKLYVWLDAPIGYISATKQWAIDNGTPEEWKKYWQNEDTALLHFIGKDNIVFHCLIFPALLKAHGDFILPVNVPANQFMNLEGRKMSTSKNWAVWVHEYLEEFPNGQDELRYNLIKNMPELQDSEFTWKRFQETTNNELVGNLANFINRVFVLTHKYFDGKIPDIGHRTLGIGKEESEIAQSNIQTVTFDALYKLVEEINAAIEKYDFRTGLQGVMDISTLGNKILQDNEPWKKFKTDPEITASVLNLSLQIVSVLSVVTQPFLPFLSARLRKLLNAPKLENGDWAKMLELLKNKQPLINTGQTIGDPVHLFTRISDETIEKQMNKLSENENEKTMLPEIIPTEVTSTSVENPLIMSATQHAPVKESISFDEFIKPDIRTATIIAAERIPKADKLLKLTVDVGFEVRTICSGIAEHFTPEEITGKQVIIVANLAPRKMRGIESNGMILMVEDAEGKLAFVTPPVGFMNGAVVK